MSDPERLRIRHAGETKGLLIESACDDAPPSDAHDRALLALGIGTAGITASATAVASPATAVASPATAVASPATAAAAKAALAAEATATFQLAGTASSPKAMVVSLMGLAKWMGFGAGAAVLGLGAAHQLVTGSGFDRGGRGAAIVASAAGPSATPSRHPTPPSLVAPPSAPAQELPRSLEKQDGSGVESAASGAAVASRLAKEIAVIDAARSALVSGNPNEALTHLDGYGRDFPRGELAPEATLLRVEALIRQGRRSSAAKLFREFQKAHPQSPHAVAMARMLEESPSP